MGKSRLAVLLVASWGALWLALLPGGARAAIPEPDAIYFGTVTIDGTPQGASSGTEVSVRRGTDGGGEELGTYTLGELPEAGDLYLLRIRLEASQGGAPTAGTAQIGERATVYVNDSPVGLVHIGGRGRVVRMDLGIASGGPTDTDDDGVPDYLDNCPTPNPTQTDLLPHNGIGDGCEGVVNPGHGDPGSNVVPVADGGNLGDDRWGTGKGSVLLQYSIQNTEVTNAEYRDFLEAVASESDPGGLYSELMASDPRGGITREGTAGAYLYLVKPSMGNKPVSFVSWLDAARYANWLENGSPQGAQDETTTEAGSYDLTGDGDPATSAVRAGSWSLPTEDEWYKAAYYDPSEGDGFFWKYPTRQDEPGPEPAQADGVGDVVNPGFAANHGAGAVWNGQAGNVTTVGPDLGLGLPRGAGSPSFYGTYDQGGNVIEWLTDVEDGRRVARGGSFLEDRLAMATTADDEGSRSREDLLWDPRTESAELGFRVVQVLEDSDADGIPDDGNGNGDPGDSPCPPGVSADCDDNCTYRSNPDQADADEDGIGDVCTCGDMNGNGILDGADLTLYKRYFGGLSSPFSTDRCGVSPVLDGGACNGADLTVITRYFGGLPPGVTNTCSAYVGP